MTVTGEIHHYEYKIDGVKKKRPKHYKCGNKMTYIWAHNKGQTGKGANKNIGYICDFCGMVLIHNKFKVFKIREINHEFK